MMVLGAVVLSDFWFIVFGCVIHFGLSFTVETKETLRNMETTTRFAFLD